MSSAQKVIKTLAIIFAIFLIVNIFSAIFWGISILTGAFAFHDYTGNKVETIAEEVITDIEKNQEITELKIDVSLTNIEIREGTEFKIEKYNTTKNLNWKVNGKTLTLEEKNNITWFQENMQRVVLTIPEDRMFQNVKISTGAGEAKISGIKTEKLKLDVGVGRTTISNLISNNTDIDGGAGSLTIENSVLNNLEFDMGVGKTVIQGKLEGNSKIKCGVGKLELNLIDELENYTIKVETGLGSIQLNRENCSDNSTYGSGDNKIKIEGGVGAVEITTK